MLTHSCIFTPTLERSHITVVGGRLQGRQRAVWKRGSSDTYIPVVRYLRLVTPYLLTTSVALVWMAECDIIIVTSTHSFACPVDGGCAMGSLPKQSNQGQPASATLHMRGVLGWAVLLITDASTGYSDAEVSFLALP